MRKYWNDVNDCVKKFERGRKVMLRIYVPRSPINSENCKYWTCSVEIPINVIM